MDTINADGSHIERSYWFWCPGCNDQHRITDLWDFNEDTESPTFTPSILTSSHNSLHVCHSYITDGQTQFLGDCTHDLAGQTVQLPELPKWLTPD